MAKRKATMKDIRVIIREFVRGTGPQPYPYLSITFREALRL